MAPAPPRFLGPVGELPRQALLSWVVFGHRLGSTLILGTTAELLDRPAG